MVHIGNISAFGLGPLGLAGVVNVRGNAEGIRGAVMR